MKFLIDQEVSLNQLDLLKSRSYANVLKDIILNAPPESAFTIGLFGEWGSGKSSIIKTVEEDISKVKDQKIQFIIYDAWKYSNDSFRRMFLLKVQHELKFNQTQLFKSFYQNKNSDIKITRKVRWFYLFLTLIAFAIGLFLITKFPTSDAKTIIATITALVGIAINVLGNSFSDYKVSVQEPMFFAPEQFEECFKDMVSRSFIKSNMLTTISKWVYDDKHVTNLDKLVIVIDNIDRCPKQLAYELITNIKNFLGNYKKVVFLIPVDDDALRRHIKKDGDSDKEAEEFLRKFFNVTIRIKPFKRFDLYDFANSINKENSIGFNETTIDIISKEFATNPRRIIQFFNNLISEIQIFNLKYGNDFCKQHESLICKILLLREEWPHFYYAISKNPNLLNNPDDIVSRFINEKEDLQGFLNVTDSISRNTAYEIIDLIFSTSDRSSKISSDIIDAIQKKNIDSILLSIAEQKVQKDILADTLIEKLNTGIKRKTFQTDVNNTFEIICIFNIAHPLDKEKHIKIYNEVRSYLNEFLPYVSDFDPVSKYSNVIFHLNLSYLDNWINTLINSINHGPDNANYSLGQKIFRTHIKNLRSEKLMPYIGLFLKDYSNSNVSIESYDLDKEQLETIINGSTIEFMAGKMQGNNEPDKFYNDFCFLNKHIDYKAEEFNTIIFRINVLNPNFINKKKAELLQIIQNISVLFDNQYAVVDSENNSQLNTLFRKFVESRNVGGTARNLFDELVESESVILLKFLIDIFKVSDGSIDIVQYLKTLLNKFPTTKDNINKYLIEVNQKYNNSLISLKTIILQDNSLTVENIQLTEILLKSKDENDNYLLDDSLIKSKLEELIKKASDDDAKAMIFLEALSNDNRIKSILGAIITALQKNQILKLSKKLQSLSFDKISEGDNIFEYKDNIELLTVMASEGSNIHSAKVVRVIIDKLTKEKKTEEGLKLLIHSKSLSKNDFNTLEGLINNISHPELKKQAIRVLQMFTKDGKNYNNSFMKHQLKIIKAVYGSESQNKEITHILTEMVDQNKLTITASNNLDGDPHPGIIKDLIIDFEFANERGQIKIKEGETATIPFSFI